MVPLSTDEVLEEFAVDVRDPTVDSPNEEDCAELTLLSKEIVILKLRAARLVEMVLLKLKLVGVGIKVGPWGNSVAEDFA